ncbi:MAG: hypothetical protein ABIH11_07885 [Candidatus Altiarchaeota archaeon]
MQHEKREGSVRPSLNPSKPYPRTAVIGVYPDNPERFPTPGDLERKLANLDALRGEVVPLLIDTPAETEFDRGRVELGRRLKRYLDRHGEDMIRRLRRHTADTRFTQITGVLGDPDGVRVAEALPGRSPITAEELRTDAHHGMFSRRWEPGRSVADFLTGCTGNVTLLSDTDMTLVPSMDAARLLLDDREKADGREYGIGLIVLDTHVDAFACSDVCKANALAVALGRMEKDYLGNVLSTRRTVEFAGVVGVPSDEDWKSSDTRSALYQAGRLSIDTDRQYYDGDSINPEKLFAVGRRIVDRMADVNKGLLVKKMVPITHLLFHIDVDALTRAHSGFEYNVLELLSRRKHVYPDDELRVTRENLAIADAVSDLRFNDPRGIPGNIILAFIRHTADYARSKGIDVGIPLPHGRYMANIGEYVPEWEAANVRGGHGSVGDFVVRTARFMDAEANRLYGSIHRV